MKSFLSHTWFPVVITWTPILNNSETRASVRPKPPAMFSPFATTRSNLYLSVRFGSRALTAFLPIFPTISPIKSILIRQTVYQSRRSTEQQRRRRHLFSLLLRCCSADLLNYYPLL